MVQYAKQSSTLRMFVLSVVMETIVSKVHLFTLTAVLLMTIISIWFTGDELLLRLSKSGKQ